MATPILDDVEISSYNSTTEELEHATSDDWRTALPMKDETQPQQQATQQQPAVGQPQTTTEVKTEQKTEEKKEATQQPQQPATKVRPEGWVPRKHLESRLRTETAARERAVADNVRLTQEVERLRTGKQPQAQLQPIAQPAAVQPEEGFKPSKPEPQLTDFKDGAGNLKYEDYDKAWRAWVIMRNDERADWVAQNQGKKLPEQIKQHTAAEQQAAERAEQEQKSTELKVKIESARVSDPTFQRVLDAPIAPPAAQKQLVGAMWGALMEVSNPTDVMAWIADNQDDWKEAVGVEEGSANYNISASKLQHSIFQLSEHLEEQAADKKNPPATQVNQNGNGNAAHTGQQPNQATPQSSQPQTETRTTPVPMPTSSAPAPSASSATRGSARTTAKALNDDSAWAGDDDGWIAARNAERARKRLPRGSSRF